jgi:hypothetical protein
VIINISALPAKEQSHLTLVPPRKGFPSLGRIVRILFARSKSRLNDLISLPFPTDQEGTILDLYSVSILSAYNVGHKVICVRMLCLSPIVLMFVLEAVVLEPRVPRP